MTRQLHAVVSIVLLALLIAGCASPRHKAPVEERGTSSRNGSAAGAAAPAAAASTPLPGAENAGKPGYYTIKPGDTLIRIGLETGQNWRDIARWNNIDNPNLIEVGQVLRVQVPGAVIAPVPVVPGADPNAVGPRPVTNAKVETRPLDPRAASAPAGTPIAPGASAPAREPDDDLSWVWPATGPVASGFDETRSKGVAITGKAGDPVLAAADGRVVYAGSGLRGYGNLVIVKHNATYLTAYAHNQTLLVKEDQVVRRGQKIAEMGSSDAERVQLHFEIRKQGKPVDPARLLPPR
jgi:lipoprotein NlpD